MLLFLCHGVAALHKALDVQRGVQSQIQSAATNRVSVLSLGFTLSPLKASMHTNTVRNPPDRASPNPTKL